MNSAPDDLTREERIDELVRLLREGARLLIESRNQKPHREDAPLPVEKAKITNECP